MSDTVYETLAREQWQELRDLFKRIGQEGNCPEPEIAQVRVARRNGKIVSFLVAQLVLHYEPLWIDPEEGKGVNWLRMLHDLEGAFLQLIREYWIFAPTTKIARMCKAAGLEEKPWRVFRKGVSCRS